MHPFTAFRAISPAFIFNDAFRLHLNMDLVAGVRKEGSRWVFRFDMSSGIILTDVLS